MKFLKVKYILPLFLFFIGSFAHADSFVQVPTLTNSCLNGLYLDPINDKFTSNKFCTNILTGTSINYWSLSGASSTGQYYIQVTSATTTFTYRYLYLYAGYTGGTSPVCPSYITDNNGNIKATNKHYYAPLNEYIGVGSFYLGGSQYNSTCVYDFGSSGAVINGFNFSPVRATSSDAFATAGSIFGITSSASSTDYVSTQSEMLSFQTGTPPYDYSTSTRIVDFTPHDGDIFASGTPVSFSLTVNINPDDISATYGVGIRITLHNIDQNALVSSFSSDDIVLYNDVTYTAGTFYYATSTTIKSGNYRVQATIDKSYLYGILQNPLANVSDSKSHQFIVGSSTFIGAISQNSYSELQTILGNKIATSTESLAKTCNPFSGEWDSISCLSFLFVPSADQLQATIVNLSEQINNRVPIGYVTRFIAILTGKGTTTLPSFTVHAFTGTNMSTTLTFNPQDMVSGAGTILDTISGPNTGKTLKDVTQPMVQLLVAIAVIFTIFNDLTGSHDHDIPTSHKKKKWKKFGKIQG